MRNHSSIDATPWEIEAARRREVIAGDFGSPHDPRTAPGSSRPSDAGLVRRLADRIVALARTEGGNQGEHGGRSPDCRPGVGAAEPGG